MRADGVVGPANGGLLGRSRHRGWRALVFAVAAGLSALSALALAGSATALPSNCTQSGTTVTCTFAYTGSAQTWTVPAGLTDATFDVQGAQGGNVDTTPGVSYTTGGLGGEATADLPLSPDATSSCSSAARADPPWAAVVVARAPAASTGARPVFQLAHRPVPEEAAAGPPMSASVVARCPAGSWSPVVVAARPMQCASKGASRTAAPAVA